MRLMPMLVKKIPLLLYRLIFVFKYKRLTFLNKNASIGYLLLQLKNKVTVLSWGQLIRGDVLSSASNISFYQFPCYYFRPHRHTETPWSSSVIWALKLWIRKILCPSVKSAWVLLKCQVICSQWNLQNLSIHLWEANASASQGMVGKQAVQN